MGGIRVSQRGAGGQGAWTGPVGPEWHVTSLSSLLVVEGCSSAGAVSHDDGRILRGGSLRACMLSERAGRG